MMAGKPGGRTPVESIGLQKSEMPAVQKAPHRLLQPLASAILALSNSPISLKSNVHFAEA
jgi:hypothetical protein